jgi:hypothetical protein
MCQTAVSRQVEKTMDIATSVRPVVYNLSIMGAACKDRPARYGDSTTVHQFDIGSLEPYDKISSWRCRLLSL